MSPSLVLHPGVKERRSRVGSGLLSDTTSDLWKYLSSQETYSEGGGMTLDGNVTNGQQCKTKQCVSLYTTYTNSPES